MRPGLLLHFGVTDHVFLGPPLAPPAALQVHPVGPCIICIVALVIIHHRPLRDSWQPVLGCLGCRWRQGPSSSWCSSQPILVYRAFPGMIRQPWMSSVSSPPSSEATLQHCPRRYRCTTHQLLRWHGRAVIMNRLQPHADRTAWKLCARRGHGSKLPLTAVPKSWKRAL